MSGVFGSSSKKTRASSRTSPWAPTIPYLTEALRDLDTAGAGLGKITPTQQSAFGQLADNAGRADDFVPDIEALTRDLFSTESASPIASDAYSTLQTQLTPFASGARTDPMSDPNMAALIESVGSDAMDRVNALFAGAGRDFSAAHVGELGREVTEATLPILSNAYQRGVDRQLGAASTLFGAGGETARTTQGLDDAALATRERAPAMASAAMDALNLPANIRLQIEEQMKTLPVEEMGLLSQYLAQIAGLGQQSRGTQKSEGTKFGLGLDVGSALSGLFKP